MTTVTRSWDDIKPSQRAIRTVNRLLTIAARLKANAPEDKSPIALSIGDPTLDGNFRPPAEVVAAMVSKIREGKSNGYVPAAGDAATRQAIVDFWGRRFAGNQAHVLKTEHTFVGSGCADIIDACISGLCNPGDNILLPSPLFPEYMTCCGSHAIEMRHYKCNPRKNWEIDLDQVRSLVDNRTRAFFINNPSNPCGSNFSRGHVEAIVKLAEELKLPIISDEIYAGMVFHGETYTSVAELDTPVPRFIIGGLSKSFIVPGWRMGWCTFADRDGQFEQLVVGVKRMLLRFRLPMTITQKAAVEFLPATPDEYFDSNVTRMENGAMYMYNLFKECDGLHPVKPQGTMFMMVELDFTILTEDIQDDVTFAKKLAEEENVQVIPGEAFLMPGFFRVTVSRPHEILEVAVERIDAFCKRHSRRQKK